MIAFVAAERREFRGLERYVAGIRSMSRPLDYAVSGTMKGHPVAMVANGPGPALVKTAMHSIGVDQFEALVSIGFCGALSARLQPSDVLVATSINGNPVLPPRHSPRSARGPLLSLDKVIVTSDEKRQLSDSGADVVEMEAAEVFEHAREHKVGFHCIRVVTDTAGESFGIDFNRMRDSTGRFSRARIIGAACRHPFKLFPELIQLDKRCQSAARALGDFIADCQF